MNLLMFDVVLLFIHKITTAMASRSFERPLLHNQKSAIQAMFWDILSKIVFKKEDNLYQYIENIFLLLHTRGKYTHLTKLYLECILKLINVFTMELFNIKNIILYAH